MPIIAANTLRAIEHAVKHDQGNTFRMWEGRVLPHIGDAYRHDEDEFRSHLGASTIGRECARELWYGFRWSTPKAFDGRMLRLFNRGHLEEGRFIALLLAAGMQVIQQDENGKQFRISDAGGHYGGSGDGMLDNCPDSHPGDRLLCEFKTHNEKSFTKLAGKSWDGYLQALYGYKKGVVHFDGEGVREAKFEHWVQMQQYMRKMNLPAAVYFAVNKNTDHVYAELVPMEPEAADRFIFRGVQIVAMDKAPDRIANSAGDYRCKFCDHRPVCHLGAAPARNCRTCEWSQPELSDGQWYCAHPDELGRRVIDKKQQLAGCPKYAVKSNSFR